MLSGVVVGCFGFGIFFLIGGVFWGDGFFLFFCIIVVNLVFYDIRCYLVFVVWIIFKY